jgi:hypothetical protein
MVIRHHIDKGFQDGRAHAWRLRAGLLLAALPIAIAFAGVAHPQASVDAAEGDWTGELRMPQGVRLAIHIRRSDAGGLTGAADSPDQGVTGMPLDVHTEGDRMILSTPVNGGQRLELTWNAANASWSGAYISSGGKFPIALTRGALKPWPKVDGLDGDWQASGSYESTTLHLALHIASTAETTTGAVTSPEQPGVTLPLGAITRSGGHVAFDIPVLRGTFSGDLSADGQTLTGAYDQSNLDAPVVFERTGSPQNKP